MEGKHCVAEESTQGRTAIGKYVVANPCKTEIRACYLDPERIPARWSACNLTFASCTKQILPEGPLDPWGSRLEIFALAKKGAWKM